MENLITVINQHTGAKLFVSSGITLSELYKMIYSESNGRFVAAWVDNVVKDLSYRLYSPAAVKFVDAGSSEGARIYARSVFFLLLKAVADVLPQGRLRLMHPVGRGYYFEIEGVGTLSSETVDRLRARMCELVSMDLPIVREKLPLDEAVEMYGKQGATDKLLLLETRPQFFVSSYNLAGVIGYLYGALVPSTGYIKTFDIESFFEGLVVMMPCKEEFERVERYCLQSKLFGVFRQNKEWNKIIGIRNVGSLNKELMEGRAGELIRIGEALQEKNFANAADMIAARSEAKIILIAGPSSSGKTSFSKRLGVQLSVLGYQPEAISLDNYFVERGLTPRDENGHYDFECLEALDVKAFNSDLKRLLAGEDVELCKFDFKTGSRFFDGTRMQLNERSILIIEGIHALNPALTPEIEEAAKFKIYASALTTLSIDDTTIVHTTDNRLLRRMVRDAKYRSRPASETLRGWGSVRRGEDKHIFPYQEQADLMFGTALFFEIPILKKYAMPLLEEVPAIAPEYAEAHRLKRFLSYFVEMSDQGLPPTSILREFIGGSSFEY